MRTVDDFLRSQAAIEKAKRVEVSVVIKDCVITERGVGWLKTNRTCNHRIRIHPTLMEKLLDHTDQRLLKCVDVRLRQNRTGEGLTTELLAIRMSPEVMTDE